MVPNRTSSTFSRTATRPPVHLAVEAVMDAVERHVQCVVDGDLQAATAACFSATCRYDLASAVRDLPSPLVAAAVEEVKHLGRNFDVRVRFVGLASAVLVTLHWHVELDGELCLLGVGRARSLVWGEQRWGSATFERALA